MWCPNCKTEYRRGVSHCDICGASLEESLTSGDGLATWSLSPKNHFVQNWPKNEDGTPEIAALLTFCVSTNMEDALLINKLEAYGIPALKRYPDNGTLGQVVLGMSGTGVNVYVPASMLEDAKALLEDTDND